MIMPFLLDLFEETLKTTVWENDNSAVRARMCYTTFKCIKQLMHIPNSIVMQKIISYDKQADIMTKT
jgi:hypothetical protein